MAAASSVPFFGLGDTQMQPQSSAPATAAAATAAPAKKKRNQPGNPSNNPDAEVIALSPRTLMATNRFVCEVCNKGFQREQNLQLHRRGHNLPWKLKQKNPKETRRRVYLCPEPTCVHHDPARALGDLTGIKKHYCRKHGEKKWKCDKCNKRYAVQSDWKAHSKTCGTREYRCDCGTLFSRRDSFITHRAFCDALARESAQMPPLGAGLYGGGSGGMALGLSGAASQMPGFADQAQSSAAAAAQFEHVMPSPSGSSSLFRSQASGSSSPFFLGGGGAPPAHDYSEDGDHSHGGGGGGQGALLHGKQPAFQGLMQVQLPHQQPGSSNGNNLLNLGFFSGNGGSPAGGHGDARLVSIQDQFSGAGAGGSGGGNAAEQGSFMAPLGSHSHLSSSFPSLYNSSAGPAGAGHLPQHSATALLMKAAQMGSTASSSHGGQTALLRAVGFGSGGQGARATGEETAAAPHEATRAHFHDLIMNSLAGGGGGGGSGGGFSGGVDDGKLSTRDFLGVGRAPPGLHIGSLDPAHMK
ncbi:hypothetical protein ACP4OV_025248 [Aristida adscensionis]